jgi:general secretion pathway protein D
VSQWLERLDQPMDTAGRRTYVYKVRNSKAVDIQNVLAQLYGGDVPVVAAPANPPPAQQAVPPGAPPFGPPPAQNQRTPVQAGDVRIVADEINNALVIQATPQEYSEIERTIQELDILRRQVLVDAQIYEVVLDDSLSFGVSATLQTRGTLANPQTTASFAGSPPSLAAQTFAFIGRTRELVLFLNASENRSRVRTLSAPSVLVSDNMQASFTVGADVPVPTSSSVTPVQADGTNLFAQTIQFRSTGVILSVRPQINDSGNVTLQIEQEVSQASANTTSAVVAPVIGKAAVSSTIVLQDGQTVALGGFIRESNDLARSRVPLLGRIPGVGVLFGNTRTSSTRTELIVLITPHVIRSHNEADLATEELKSKLREIQRFLN